MRSRGLVVAIAVVLAVLAAAGVIVYTNSLEDTLLTENTVEVVVSKQNIAANTALGPLVTAGNFDLILVPDEAVVAGAITVINDLSDETTAAPILANEQIPSSRLASGNNLNQLGITPGNLALGLSIGGPQSVNGYISQGDNVVVFATFKAGTPVTKEALSKVLRPDQIQAFYDSLTGVVSGNPADQPVLILPFEFTTTLIRSVKVIAIQNPSVDEQTGRKASGETTMALDLVPDDATNLVYASGQAQLYLGLLPPENEEGYQTGAAYGVPLVKVTGVGT
ncbi:MAG: SAF domain-containing protein [Actinomycetota bacterium]